MRVSRSMVLAGAVVAGAAAVVAAQQGGQTVGAQAPAAPDPAQILVDRLNLDGYKATIKGLTQFGDRREGTQRNRDAVSWIEAQLKSYGCATERMEYENAPRGGGGGNAGGGANRGAGAGAAGAGAAGAGAAGAAGAGAAGGAGRQTGRAQQPPATVLTQPNRRGTGGSTYYGITRPTGVNNSQSNAEFGNGVSASIGLDDPTVWDRTAVYNLSIPAAIGANGTGSNAYSGTHSPDVVGRIRVDQAWGLFQLSAAAHEVSASYNTLGASGVPNGLSEISGHPETRV